MENIFQRPPILMRLTMLTRDKMSLLRAASLRTAWETAHGLNDRKQRGWVEAGILPLNYSRSGDALIIAKADIAAKRDSKPKRRLADSNPETSLGNQPSEAELYAGHSRAYNARHFSTLVLQARLVHVRKSTRLNSSHLG